MKTLSREQFLELGEHQAFPHGGWKLAGGIVFQLLLMVSAWFMIRWVEMHLDLITTTSWVWLTGDGVLAVMVAVMVVLALMNGVLLLRQLSWLHPYWRRNVVGYVARFYHGTATGEDGKECRKLQYLFTTRREDSDFRWRTHREPGGTIAISLPLGGWFAEPWILAHGRTQIDRLQGWSVKLRAIFYPDDVIVELWKRNVSWKTDAVIVMDISRVFQHLEEIATSSYVWSGVSDLVRHVDIKLRVAERERDVARGEVDRYMNGFLPAAVKDRDEARKDRDEAIRCERQGQHFFLWTIVRYMEATTRLTQTVEGLRIFVDCVAKLVELDPGNVELSTKLESARRLLAEKELRARRRHGKAKADPATAA